MWLVADFEASTLFSLKPATATASGGKTLLVPTPFALKMALLDVACRLEGRDAAAHAWDEWLARLIVALRPPPEVVVNNTFIKVLRPRRNPAPPGTRHAGFFQQTITYREYAQWAGALGVALELSEQADAKQLARWLAHVNYLGKRGSFVQIQAPARQVEVLPEGFVVVNGTVAGASLDSLLTQLDDVGEGLDFARADIYSGKGITLGKHRVLRHVALPYRLATSSRGYSHYRLAEDER